MAQEYAAIHSLTLAVSPINWLNAVKTTWSKHAREKITEGLKSGDIAPGAVDINNLSKFVNAYCVQKTLGDEKLKEIMAVKNAINLEKKDGTWLPDEEHVVWNDKASILPKKGKKGWEFYFKPKPK